MEWKENGEKLEWVREQGGGKGWKENRERVKRERRRR
jgi:hypothetical protein